MNSNWKPGEGEGSWLWQMWAGVTSGWYSIQNRANGVRGWGFEAGRCQQRLSVIDIAAILGLLFIRQPESTKDPYCFVIWARWWIPCYKECAGTWTCIKETLEQTPTHSLFRHIHKHTLVLCSVAAVICHLDPYHLPSKNLPTYYFTQPQLGEEIPSWAANGIFTC